MSLTSVYHTGPVTALHCHGNIILAGIGSQIHVYSIHNTKLHQSIDILPARVVHGIKQVFDDGASTKLCVFGQKCLRLVEVNDLSLTIKPLNDPLEFSDWIWDVSWIQDSPSSRLLCLALGHNVIVTYDVDKFSITNSVHCQEKCILYCAKFLTSKSDCVILASGTVFNQVVIWSAQSTVNTSGRVEPFHRLTGHQGVIFSIDYNETLKLICSVSDDRSIRLYKVKFPGDNTGQSLEDWEKMETSLLHVLYGHSARVWDVKLLSTSFVSVGEDSTCCIWSYEGKVLKKFKGHKGKSIWSICVDKGEHFVITGGGDNSVRLWNLHHEDRENKDKLTKSVDFQLEADDFPRNTMLLDVDRILAITNAGKLVLYNQKSGQCSPLMSDVKFGSYTVMSISPTSQCIAIGNIHGTLRILHVSEASMFDKGQYGKTDVQVHDGKLFSVVWIREDTVLTTAAQGMVNMWKITNHDDEINVDMTFTFILPPSKHCWVSTATIALDDTRIVVGDRTGSLFLYKLIEEKKTGELVQTFPKIHGKAGATFLCCRDNHVYSAGRDGMYRMFVWTEVGELELLHNNRVCKSFEWLEKLEFTDDDDIHIYGFYTNMFIIWSVRQNQKLLEIECGGGHRAWDYRCHGNSAAFVYVKTREVKVTNVEMRSNQVIVKKCLHGRELCDAKHICLGYDGNDLPVNVIVTCSEDTSVCLSVLTYENGIPQLDVCQNLTGHISTVRCMYVCSSSQTVRQAPAAQMENPNIHRKLIFSGGGRAQLKVWSIEVKFLNKVNGEKNNIKDENNIRGTTYCKTCDKDNSCTAMRNVETGTSEQLQKCVNEHENTVVEHIHSDKDSFKAKTTYENNDSDLLEICDKDVNGKVEYEIDYICLAGLQLSELKRKCKKPWRQPFNNSDPETRILDLSVVTPNELGQIDSRSLYFISIACSDGYLRLLAFDEMSRMLTLVASSPYHDHCVLKTSHVILPNAHMTQPCDQDHVTESDQWPVRVVILSAATDGKVAFWDVTEICKEFTSTYFSESLENTGKKGSKVEQKLLDIDPFFALELHQSGINNLYFGKYSDKEYVLVTGGDDNAVHVNIVTIVTDVVTQVKVVAKGQNTNAHSAQITGAWYVMKDYIVTASIDQRICVWKLMLQNSVIQLKMIGCVWTSVSDIANMDVWKEKTHYCLLISGNGMEIFRLELCDQSEEVVMTNVQSSHKTICNTWAITQTKLVL